VSEQAFSAWVEEAKKKYARKDEVPSTQVASAQSRPQ